jgi:hypothetical protein
MTTLAEKEAEWLYEHFQAISHAADRYIAILGFLTAFSFAVILAPQNSYKVPVLELEVTRDILLAAMSLIGGFVFVAYCGTFDKGETTLTALAASLSCGYEDLWFVDTHPTIVDFARELRDQDRDKRVRADRFLSAMLYAILLGLALVWLTLVPLLGLFESGQSTLHRFLYAIALLCLVAAWRRAKVFIGRRWRTFRAQEKARLTAI